MKKKRRERIITACRSQGLDAVRDDKTVGCFTHKPGDGAKFVAILLADANERGEEFEVAADIEADVNGLLHWAEVALAQVDVKS
jgi:hypothetical protein